MRGSHLHKSVQPGWWWCSFAPGWNAKWFKMIQNILLYHIISTWIKIERSGICIAHRSTYKYQTQTQRSQGFIRFGVSFFILFFRDWFLLINPLLHQDGFTWYIAAIANANATSDAPGCCSLLHHLNSHNDGARLEYSCRAGDCGILIAPSSNVSGDCIRIGIHTVYFKMQVCKYAYMQ